MKQPVTTPPPKISIVMPCFNCVDYIERSIRSVVEQKHPSIELIIQDGGSQDGTLDIIKHYARQYPKIINWVSEPDQGQTDAINRGMRKATGQILTYLNADDVYKPGALSVVAQYFITHPQTRWAYGQGDIIDGNDQLIRGPITAYKNFWLQHYSYTTLLILNYISQMACFWRREAAEAIGEFDTQQFYVMDYDYWLRLGELYQPGIIPQYLASFRIVPTTKSAGGFVNQFQDELAVAKKHTGNSLIIFLHYLHHYAIIAIYSLMLFFNKTIRSISS